ncbi:MAG: ABC transporter substrate-binding protein [Nitrospinaceae bacterium]|nr:ABC transporter substrate-binding protein [Nitrospinaceae bacterium]MBT3433455.1 ABC transporter substrate-binding protein [Nitrospinaceae bacterium]MBT3820173.1 ABC transporter substrate-binding protein [Nitrospinaceae bacterium]MBT4094930.1 ABC transporter substrate-binding protein [Nitrospinaceae bacterium]MBT4430950.1 ABC transporter substrate-binding protein [Nitrospinaceae bacterium]
MAIGLIENFRAVFYAPFYAAFSLGAYEAEGVEVAHKKSSGPAQTSKAVLSGDGDVFWGGPMRVLVAGDSNPDCGLVSFCEVVARDPFFLVGRGAVPEGGFSGYAGKRIATVSEVPTPWMCFQHDLLQAGVEPGALERIADRSMTENAEALRAGEIDAVQVFQPFAEELLVEGNFQIWFAAASRGLTTYTAFNTTKEFLEREPDALLKMTRAMYRTQKWIDNNSAEAFAGCIASYFPEMSHDLLSRAIARYKSLGIWNKTPMLEREGYERLRASCISGALIREGIPYDAGVDMKFAELVIDEDPDTL